MAISGEKRFGMVGQQHWARLARRAGVDPEWLWGRVINLAAELPDAPKPPEGYERWFVVEGDAA